MDAERESRRTREQCSQMWSPKFSKGFFEKLFFIAMENAKNTVVTFNF